MTISMYCLYVGFDYTYICKYVCTYERMYVCMYVCVCVCVRAIISKLPSYLLKVIKFKFRITGVERKPSGVSFLFPVSLSLSFKYITVDKR